MCKGLCQMPGNKGNEVPGLVELVFQGWEDKQVSVKSTGQGKIQIRVTKKLK